MKANNNLFTVTLLAVSVVMASAAPPGGMGPGWAAGKVAGSRGWRGTPSSGVFAGDVALYYDANGDGKLNAKDNSKAFAAQKATTPGLPLRRGAVLKVALHAVSSPPAPGVKLVRNPEFRDYKTVVGLEIKGINLMSRSGKFATVEEENSVCGRVLVWLDASRRTLILDSADPGRRYVEWRLAEGPVPEFLYVQAVANGSPGGAFRLTGSVDDSNQSYLADKMFGRRAGYDHLIVNTAR